MAPYLVGKSFVDIIYVNILAYQDTMMMGADFYETEEEVAEILKNGKIPLGVGANSRISNCIIDKNARIGKNVVIANTDVRTLEPSTSKFH